jgi:hypothetical protein
VCVYVCVCTGISGLKELGVRDLTYRLCFLCCAVRSTNSNSIPNPDADEVSSPVCRAIGVLCSRSI